MDFSTVAATAAVVAGFLGLGWIFAGGLVLKRWGVEANAQALLVGRRIGAVYVGLAVLAVLVRHAPASDLRRAIAAGFTVVLVLLAAMGIYEFACRRVRGGILASVTIELALAAGFALQALAAPA